MVAGGMAHASNCSQLTMLLTNSLQTKRCPVPKLPPGGWLNETVYLFGELLPPILILTTGVETAC